MKDTINRMFNNSDAGTKSETSNEMDTLISFLDLCGFYDEMANNEAPRIRLLSVLSGLEITFTKYHKANGDNSLDLLLLETQLNACRRQLEEVQFDLKNTLLHLMSFDHDGVKREDTRFQLSIASENFFEHARREFDEIHELKTAFEHVYPPQSDALRNILFNIRLLTQSFKRFQLFNSASFQALANAIQQSQPARNCENMLRVKEKTDGFNSNSPQFYQSNMASPIDVVNYFLTQDVNLIPVYSSLLLIGPYGSGKSYICNSICSLADQHVLGKYIVQVTFDTTYIVSC
jgi:hypothetical protein